MRNDKKIKILIISFIILSIIKLFTAKVGLLGDSTVQLVIKINPAISNNFIMKGEDNEVNRARYEGTWYYERKYKVITGDESGFKGEWFYNLLIGTWWILSVGLTVYLLTISTKSIKTTKIT